MVLFYLIEKKMKEETTLVIAKNFITKRCDGEQT